MKKLHLYNVAPATINVLDRTSTGDSSVERTVFFEHRQASQMSVCDQALIEYRSAAINAILITYPLMKPEQVAEAADSYAQAMITFDDPENK